MQLFKTFFHLTLVFGCLVTTPLLTSCNTVEGFGEDVENVGDTIEEGGESGFND